MTKQIDMRKVFCIFTTPIIVKTNHTWQKQWGILQTFQLYAQFQLAFRINLLAIYLSNIRAGKLTGRYFHPWKPQTVARVSEGCLLKGPKKSKTWCFFFFNHHVLPQFWNNLSVNFTFYPHMFTCFWSCLAVALSTQSLLCLERHCHRRM